MKWVDRHVGAHQTEKRPYTASHEEIREPLEIRGFVDDSGALQIDVPRMLRFTALEGVIAEQIARELAGDSDGTKSGRNGR